MGSKRKEREGWRKVLAPREKREVGAYGCMCTCTYAYYHRLSC